MMMMSLGIGAIKGWREPNKNIKDRREVPWQPCELCLASGHQPAQSH